MASSSENAGLSSRRQSTTNKIKEADLDLSHSLKQLSLSTASPAARSPRSPNPLSPFKPALNRASPSPGPGRVPARSPSIGRDSRSRSSTPTLLRKASINSLHSANGMGPGQSPSRRSSSAQISSPTSKSPLSLNTLDVQEKPAPTANSVASEYFATELEALHAPGSMQQTEAVVILHDACYGHRFSRPRTTRASLSTIVERPERIKAGVLGVAMAYVRLGERHCDGAYPIHPKLNPATIPTLPFRIHKTTRKLPLMSQAVTNVHGTKWMEELKIMCDAAESKLAHGGKELQRPEMNRGPDQETPAKFHEGDLYLCAESLDALEGALGAVCEAVDTVFTTGPRRAFVAVRPPGHHCSASYPSGFCWLNNVHVGIMHAILNHGLTHAAIIDFDLHHGDGSQSITWQHNSRGTTLPKNAAAWKKSSIGYFSLHDINSYPCEMGDEEKVKNASLCIDNAHGQNIWNVHLQPWATEAEFWQLYESKYRVILDKTRAFLKTQSDRLRSSNQAPKAAIFFSAGFDASEWESAGMQRHNVNVPTEFYARVAQDVVKIAAEEGLSVEGRVISVLEGGYSDRALFSGICSHITGLAGDQSPSTTSRGRDGLAFEMGQRMGVVQDSKPTAAETPSLDSLHAYDPLWWSSAELDRLETAMGNPPPEPKKPRHVTPPTYSSPTQASTARVVNPAKMRRSMSGLSSLSNGSFSRPPSPPPPEVPWMVAAHELSKLLIPADRQTDSCKAEDLNAEATRARRDRQSGFAAPVPAANSATADRPTSRMALRERRAIRAIAGVDGTIDEEDEKQLKGRRKTVGPSVLSTEKAAARGIVPDANGDGPVKRAARRLSAASTIISTPTASPPKVANGNGIPRPGSSHSVRPESSMSVRTQAGTSLAVKKTRAVPAARKEAPKAPRGTKKTTSVASSPARTQNNVAAPARQNGGGTVDNSADDLDRITAGMKKIKINLITKAQKEERAKASQSQSQTSTPPAVEESKPIFPPPPSEPTPATTPQVVIPSYDGTADLSPTELPPLIHRSSTPAVTAYPSVSTPTQLHTPVSLSPDPRQVPLPASSPAPQPLSGATSDPDMFVPYQPEGPAPVPVPQQEPLKWLPPNTSTPNVMRRTDLPIFTATSAIPFAPRKIEELANGFKTEQAPKPEPEQTTSVWEVPETPQK